MRQTNFYWLLIPALAMAAGCGKSDEKRASTQVVAKVNSEEISVHQINAILNKTEGITPENLPRVKQETINKLIDQRLAIQQAIEQHLDRTPEVMQAVEAAKADILARAYQDQVASTEPKPNAAEIRKFYADHPELFAERRIFNLLEIALPNDANTLATLKQQVAQGQAIEEIATNLKAKEVRFDANAVVRPAEQIPLELLPRYLALQNGQTILIETPQVTIITRLVDSKSQPMDEVTATPFIQNFLTNQRATEAVARDMKQLREKARIEIVGEFAAPPASPPEKTAPPVNRTVIEKGVADLK